MRRDGRGENGRRDWEERRGRRDEEARCSDGASEGGKGREAGKVKG